MDPTSAICTPNWPSLAPHDALTRPASQAPLKRAPRIKSGAHHKQGDWRQGARQLPRRSARKVATRPARFCGTARCAAITHGGMRTSKLQRRGIGALNSRTCGGSGGRFTMPLSGWRARPSPPSASSAMGLHNSGATVPGRARRQLRSTLTEPTLHAGHETSISWRGFFVCRNGRQQPRSSPKRKTRQLASMVLDVEKNPFRSIGAAAAALAFIVSVAIILVSAEVSRISAVA